MSTALQTRERHGATAAAASAEPAQYLTFMLAGEVFAIGILAIKEIIEYRGLTEVPMMPACVRGVIIVIVEVEAAQERHVIGVVVDAVNEVLEIPATDIEPPPAFGARIRSDFIQGMGKVRDKFVILLDANQVLSIDEALHAMSASSELPASA